MSYQVLPRTAWLTVNRACNLRCQWCYSQGTRFDSKQSMSLALATRLLSFIEELKIVNVQILGGEPTYWPHLLELNQIAKKKSIETAIITNAMRFADDKFWSKYKEHPNSSIGISVKAANPKDLLDVAKSHKFDKLRIGLRRAISLPQSSVSVTHNVFYVGKLPELAKFVFDLGAFHLRIDFCQTIFEAGEAVNKFMIESKEIVSEILECYGELMDISNGKLLFGMNMPLCLWPVDFIKTLIERKQINTVCHVIKRRGLVFGIDGQILMCNALFDFPLGKLEKDFDNANSIMNLLNRPDILSYYDKISSYPSSQCQNCGIYDWCGGGCPLKWAIYNPQEEIPGFSVP